MPGPHGTRTLVRIGGAQLLSPRWNRPVEPTVRATSLRITSPTTIPRTPPAGFLKAVMRPSLTASITGTSNSGSDQVFAQSEKPMQCWRARQQGSQMFAGHAWTSRRTFAGCPQIAPKLCLIQLESEAGALCTLSSGNWSRNFAGRRLKASSVSRCERVEYRHRAILLILRVRIGFGDDDQDREEVEVREKVEARETVDFSCTPEPHVAFCPFFVHPF